MRNRCVRRLGFLASLLVAGSCVQSEDRSFPQDEQRQGATHSSLEQQTSECLCEPGGELDAGIYAIPAPEPPRALAPPPDALNVLDFGAQPGADCREAIQSAIDRASAAGGGTVLVPAATRPYRLSAIASPFVGARQIALRLRSSVTLFVATGATLQLDEDQQDDTRGPVDLIAFDGRSVSITGGGVIAGNTQGQPRWTGAAFGGRYSQIDGGCLLRGFLPLEGITISDLHLIDSFANPIDINADRSVRIERIQSSGTGEGVLVIGARDVTISDVDHDDLADVSEGDGLEVSCVHDFSIRRVRVRASGGGAGAALDIYGSSNGLVEQLTSDGWAWGIEAHDRPDDACVSENVEVRQVSIANAAATGLLFSRQSGSIRFHHVKVSHCDVGLQVLGENRFPPLYLRQIDVSHCKTGFWLRSARDTHLESSTVADSAGNGILVLDSPGGTAARLELVNVSATKNAGYGLEVSGPASMRGAAQIRVLRSQLTENAAGAYAGLPREALVQETIPAWP